MTNSNTSTLHVDLRVGQSMWIGDAHVMLFKKDGQRARLVIQAPRDMPIKPPSPTTGAQECASIMPK